MPPLPTVSGGPSGFPDLLRPGGRRANSSLRSSNTPDETSRPPFRSIRRLTMSAPGAWPPRARVVRPVLVDPQGGRSSVVERISTFSLV